ncbi:hypothetical protein BDY21DRAFT_348808 [Lineolata rhizophorae]|uniref:Uncharacterized protein n=1 Tax=Lineolata rhizophorae TaxID=578093 RepID=A0A6A6NW87_9PEZI|nr:hypothetical protein BDY21DRAFT_348808 [Lineolata rhizophorae]
MWSSGAGGSPRLARTPDRGFCAMCGLPHPLTSRSVAEPSVPTNRRPPSDSACKPRTSLRCKWARIRHVTCTRIWLAASAVRPSQTKRPYCCVGTEARATPIDC